MSTLDDIREEARVIRKRAGETGDWLQNPAIHKRYSGDAASLERKRGEMLTMFRAADRLDSYAKILADREAA